MKTQNKHSNNQNQLPLWIVSVICILYVGITITSGLNLFVIKKMDATISGNFAQSGIGKFGDSIIPFTYGLIFIFLIKLFGLLKPQSICLNPNSKPIPTAAEGFAQWVYVLLAGQICLPHFFGRSWLSAADPLKFAVELGAIILITGLAWVNAWHIAHKEKSLSSIEIVLIFLFGYYLIQIVFTLESQNLTNLGIAKLALGLALSLLVPLSVVVIILNSKQELKGLLRIFVLIIVLANTFFSIGLNLAKLNLKFAILSWLSFAILILTIEVIGYGKKISAEKILGTIVIGLFALTNIRSNSLFLQVGDDFHLGEVINPATQMLKFGDIPFRDFINPIGALEGLIPAAVSILLFGNPFSGLVLGYYIIYALFVALFFIVVRRLTNSEISTLLVLVLPPPQNRYLSELFGVLLLLTAITITRSKREKLSRVLSFKQAMLILIILNFGLWLAPAQAGFAILTFGFFLTTIRIFEENYFAKNIINLIKDFIQLIGAQIVILGPLYLAGHLPTFLNILQVSIAQASVNTQAHGISSLMSLITPSTFTNSASIILPLCIGPFIYIFVKQWEFKEKVIKVEEHKLVFALAIVGVVWIVSTNTRYNGRIDEGLLSRPGLGIFTTLIILFVCSALLFNNVDLDQRKIASTFTSLILIIFLALYSNNKDFGQFATSNTPNLERKIDKCTNWFKVEGNSVKGLEDCGFSNDRVEVLNRIQNRLNAFPDGNSGVINLTNNSLISTSLKFDTFPKISSPYVTITKRIEDFAIRSLEDDKPTFGIGYIGTNMYLDSISIGMRSPRLWTYIQENYQPIECGDDVFLRSREISPINENGCKDGLVGQDEVNAWRKINSGTLPIMLGKMPYLTKPNRQSGEKELSDYQQLHLKDSKRLTFYMDNGLCYPDSGIKIRVKAADNAAFEMLEFSREEGEFTISLNGISIWNINDAILITSNRFENCKYKPRFVYERL